MSVDPVQIVVSAIVAGTAHAATQAVRSAYQRLKTLVGNWMSSRPHAPDPFTLAVEGHDARVRIEMAVRTSGLASSQETLDAAVALLQAVDMISPGIEGGVVGQINAAGGKVVAIGANYGTITL